MIRRRSVQKRLRRKIRSGKDKIVLRSLADMDIKGKGGAVYEYRNYKKCCFEID